MHGVVLARTRLRGYTLDTLLLEHAAAGQVLACGAYTDGAARVQTVLRAGDGGEAQSRARGPVL